MATPIQLIVGLGNPGSQYESTRHNAGAWFAQLLEHHADSDFRVEKKFFGQLCTLSHAGQSARVLIPSTYMNESGKAVAAIANYFKIAPQHILVAHDELDLPVGTIKLKKGGGHGGHNGLRDIIKGIGSSDFYRLRIGIGHPGHKDRVHDYVLSNPSRADAQKITATIETALSVINDLLAGEIDRATRNLHNSTR